MTRDADGPGEPRVLIIDDDDLLRETLRHVLEAAGFEIAEAANGSEGIRAYEAEPADVVVTDILMPEKEGVETIIELRDRFPDARIVAMSGGDRAGNIRYLEMVGKLGADRVLAKPFRAKDLVKIVRDLITGG